MPSNSFPILAFGFGLILLLIAILGGGFELQQLKVPKVSGAVRVASAITGALFVILSPGASIDPAPPLKAEPVDTRVSVGPANPVTDSHASISFSIGDELADSQIEEQVTVRIDGRAAGTLSVDLDEPLAQITVSGTGPGRHDYTLSSLSTFDMNGRSVTVAGFGTGTIDVRDGAFFDVVVSDSTDDRLELSLWERSRR